MGSEVSSMIATLGFPIFACVGMAYYIYLKEKMHTEEKKQMTDALNRNTEIMIEIKTLIEMQKGN